jgi:hypothetical protein
LSDLSATSGVSSKRVAIVQSNYIPWKGYFDLINRVDEFILFDDRQYTRRDWRNRNRIKTPRGLAWVTIPVEVKGKYHQRIDETRISDPDWSERHWDTLAQHYRGASAFRAVEAHVRETYEALSQESRLSIVNRTLIEMVCGMLGIQTTLRWSTEYKGVGSKTERLLSLCVQSNATSYLSGPAARVYLDETLFEEAGIAVDYVDYSGYPEYEQLHPPFEHAVTILDLIFSTGADAPRYLKSFVSGR